jgi:hypothetical protein
MAKKELSCVYAWENGGHLVNDNAFTDRKKCVKAIGNYLGRPVLMVNVKSKMFDRLCRKRLQKLVLGKK